MKRRDLIKKLEAAGYRVARDTGDHSIYVKSGGATVSPAAPETRMEVIL